MNNKLFAIDDANQAAELIGRNVSFDFQAFLGKVGPAPSRVLPKRKPDQRRADSKPAQNGFQDRSQKQPRISHAP